MKGHSVRCIDYYEAVGQDLAAHLNWLRSQGYTNAECILPHDGAKADAFTAIRFEDHIRSAGFTVRTIPNQGKGAAMKRVEAARRIFGQIWFDEKRTDGGLKALGWYHEKKDEVRNIGLGPEHDWSSHAADSFGLMCCDWEEPRAAKKPSGKNYRSGGWMR
jgi:phage terminase large subunit